VRTDCDIAPSLNVLGDREVVSQLLTARVDNGHVDVAVSDNGAGVPAHVRTALFESFAGEGGMAQGRGLGLSVARGLAAQLGATLRLTDSSDAGTTFTVRFRALPPG